MSHWIAHTDAKKDTHIHKCTTNKTKKDIKKEAITGQNTALLWSFQAIIGKNNNCLTWIFRLVLKARRSYNLSLSTCQQSIPPLGQTGSHQQRIYHSIHLYPPAVVGCQPGGGWRHWQSPPSCEPAPCECLPATCPSTTARWRERSCRGVSPSCPPGWWSECKWHEKSFRIFSCNFWELQLFFSFKLWMWQKEDLPFAS